MQSSSGLAHSRLVSLDVFRGGTIAAMILVNNQMSPEAYGPLLHAHWHGWTFTDLVFPSFLWIVGVAMTLSMAKRVARGDDKGRMLLHVLRRAALIFGIGVLLNLIPAFDFERVRIPGVLQRIALCYLIASAIFLYFRTVGRIVWAAVLLGVYWGLMVWVAVPGCGAGSFALECNFAKWIDGMVLSGHMWSRSKTWDPEGLVSTLPAVCNTLFGIFAGQILASKKAAEEKTVWLFVAGNLMVFGGMMLSTWMPVNKQLWTVPFALLTSGIAFVVFAICYWLVDQRGWQRWKAPFAIFGVNALAMFVVSGMFSRFMSLVKVGGVSLSRIAWDGFYSGVGNANGSLLYGLTHVLACFLMAWGMYRRGWILKV
jgi:predicted acyltransferase